MSQAMSEKGPLVREVNSDNAVHQSATTRPRRGRLCGLRTGAVVLLAAIVLIIILGVALGAGLGVGLHSASSSSSSSSSPETATSSTAIASATGAAAAALSFTLSYGAAATSSVASSTSSAGPEATYLAATTCPGSNGTTYTSSAHTYLIFCENDMRAPDQTDLGRVYQPSFTSCIDHCAAEATAQGRSDISVVYWVHYDATAAGTCWCIGNSGPSSGRNVTYNPSNNLALIMS